MCCFAALAIGVTKGNGRLFRLVLDSQPASVYHRYIDYEINLLDSVA